MRIGWRSAKVDKALAHKEVHAEAARNYCGLRHRKADLRDVYRGGDYGGIQNYIDCWPNIIFVNRLSFFLQLVTFLLQLVTCLV